MGNFTTSVDASIMVVCCCFLLESYASLFGRTVAHDNCWEDNLLLDKRFGTVANDKTCTSHGMFPKRHIPCAAPLAHAAHKDLNLFATCAWNNNCSPELMKMGLLCFLS